MATYPSNWSTLRPVSQELAAQARQGSPAGLVTAFPQEVWPLLTTIGATQLMMLVIILHRVAPGITSVAL
jgi:hypothetical protein